MLDMHAVEQHRLHADQHAILDGAAMNHRRMPDGHLVTDDGRMRLPHHVHHRQILDIGALADANVIHVAANDDVHPDR